MNINQFLDQLLQSGKEMAQKGQGVAESQLGVPAEGEQRDAMVSGLGKGAAIAGVLAMLLGTKTGRRATGTGLKVGGLAALGGLAYQMYNRWQQGKAAPVAQLEPPVEQPPKLDSATLLKAMVAAAKADGHVSEEELNFIRAKLAEVGLDADANDLVMDALLQPLDADAVAAMAGGDKEAAIELYLVSSMLIDDTNEGERQYLADLQTALGLPDEVVAPA